MTWRPTGLAVGRREKRFHALYAIILTCTLSGCAATMPRNPLPEKLVDRAQIEGMQRIRIWGDGTSQSLRESAKVEAPKLQALVEARARKGARPSLNILAVSGGAEDGAFGAGVLVGWSIAGTRPTFDVVTGVSAGALIAPFAFLGRDKDAELSDVFTQYSQDDIFTTNILSGIFGGPSLADSAPLANLISRHVDLAFLRAIARERMKGRILLIGTTNLDAQRPVLWDMGRIAMYDNNEALTLFRQILLASASIPGIFPPVRIQVRADGKFYDELHVDGGVTQQVFVAPISVSAKDVAPGIQRLTRRMFIIRNSKITPDWEAVEPKTLSITQRSLSTLIKNEGIGDLYRLYAAAKRDGTDFNLAAIPPSFKLKSPQPFGRKYMQALFNVGYQAGSHGYRWMKAPPGLSSPPHSISSRDPRSSGLASTTVH